MNINGRQNLHEAVCKYLKIYEEMVVTTLKHRPD